jgi:hypothetical protein
LALDLFTCPDELRSLKASCAEFLIPSFYFFFGSSLNIAGPLFSAA